MQYKQHSRCQSRPYCQLYVKILVIIVYTHLTEKIRKSPADGCYQCNQNPNHNIILRLCIKI